MATIAGREMTRYTRVSARAAACTENFPSQIFVLSRPIVKSTSASPNCHVTPTHERVTHVCWAGRSRVSTQPTRLVRVTVSGHSLLYRDTCYCHLSVLIPNHWWLVVSWTGHTFTDRTFHWSGHFNAGRGWGVGSFKFIQTNKGLVFKLAIILCHLYEIWKQHTPRAQSP